MGETWGPSVNIDVLSEVGEHEQKSVLSLPPFSSCEGLSNIRYVY
jgi:hypothetical protein